MLHAWKFGESNITITYGEPDSYFTMVLRTTIVGIECALQSSALEELLFTNRLTEEIRHALRKPSTRSMVDSYYNKIPRYVSADAPLKVHNGPLWKKVEQFYREVRNPIFHGYQLRDVNAEALLGVFGMLDEIFRWIDSWKDPNRFQNILAATTFYPLS